MNFSQNVESGLLHIKIFVDTQFVCSLGTKNHVRKNLKVCVKLRYIKISDYESL